MAKQIQPVSGFDGTDLPIPPTEEEQLMAQLNEVQPLEEPSYEVMEQQPERSVASDFDPRMVADLGASLGPSVLALLGGASPNVVSGLMDKGNQYAMKRGAQEEVTKDKISVIDEGGLPLNVLTRDSVGKRPYYQAKAGALSGGQKDQNVQSKMTFANKKTGELMSTYLARNGQMYRVGETPDTANPLDPSVLSNEYVPFFGFGTAKSKSMYGDESVIQFQKTQPEKKTTIGGTQGYAGTQNVPTEGLKVFEKSQDEFNKIAVPLEQKRKSLNDAINIIGNKNSTSTEMAAAQEAIIRGIINDPILTEGDVPRAMGDNYKSLFKQVTNAVSRKAVGSMNQTERADMLKSAKSLATMLDTGISSMYEKFKGEVSTIPGASDLAKKRNPQIEKRSKANQAELIRIKEIAKKQFGNDKKAYDSYIKLKQNQLGL